ncbi:MAG: hypothetical protein ABFS34_08600 [Gemmatimonadota bacterium]
MTVRGARARSAVAFGAAGAVLTSLWFLPVVAARGDLAAAALYIVGPVLAAALAGWMLGGPLCAPPTGYGPGRAVVTGAAVASLSALMFGAFFSTLYVAGDGTVYALRVGAGVALLAVVVLGPVILLVGATTGLLLYRYGCQQMGRPVDSPEAD